MFNISHRLVGIIFSIYIIALGFIYYFIFKKHHKRNKIDFSELISLIVKFYTTVTISLIIIGFGIYCIIDANKYKDDRMDVISYVSLGIIIISVVIINFIFYLKRSLKDLNPVVREESKKRTMKIGEVLELIIFTLLVFVPIFRIHNLIEIFDNRKEFIIELVRDIAISASSIILLINLNPCKIKERMSKLFKKNSKE